MNNLENPDPKPAPRVREIPKRPRHTRNSRIPRVPMMLFALIIVFATLFLLTLILGTCFTSLQAFLQPIEIVSLILAAISFIALSMALPDGE